MSAIGRGSLKGGGLTATGLKARALDAALALVEAHGVHRLSVRELADAIGTGPASLYYYFKNKDALVGDLAAEGFRRLTAVFLSAQRDPRGRPGVNACGAAYLPFIREHPMLYAVMYDERILAGQPVAQAAERQAFQAFAQALAAAHDGGADVAYALWALGRGTAALCMAHGDPNNMAARDVAQQIIRGLEALLGRPLRVGDDHASPGGSVKG